MAGRRLTPSEHALIVYAVRMTGNVKLSQAMAAGYFFFVTSDDEATWLEGIMEAPRSRVTRYDDDEQIQFPEWQMPGLS